ncbi:MAG TPA: Rieske 2Fe-2S domain-containing protein [Blastocatellia bacterium]|nr:Rieske 2Fe-2S domain-containing protein [Blastocatellia bacterium]
MTERSTAKPSGCGAPPADAFPDWPNGWYALASSDQLGRKPLGIDLLGRRLVCYRAASGQPVIMDARCWHLGADLSDGSVIGDRIACPFHGWRYGPSGQCESIPAQADPPRCAKQQTYYATERVGRVFIFPAARATYPLPFFTATDPDELIAAPPFEFVLRCPWWLIGTNGFDLQHFSAAHDRRLLSPPFVESPHPAARRIVATFEVCGDSWRDHLTRRLAGRRVTMDTTVWSGTLAFVMAHFHNSDSLPSGLNDIAPRVTSYGMTEIRPLSTDLNQQSLVRVTIFRRRRRGRRALDHFDVRIKRHFIRAFLKPDTRLLDDARYDPDHLIHADREMAAYLQWLGGASRGEFKIKESS